jgi:hypothetical protein
MKTHLSITALEKRLAKVEEQLGDYRRAERKNPPNYERMADAEDESYVIRAHFGRVALERKPFVVTLEGGERISRTLTPIRTAILLVLLMDLLERSETGSSSQDNVARVKEALAELAPDESAESSHDAVRVALYRAGQFIKDEFSGAVNDELSFAVEKGAMVILHRGTPIPPRFLQVEITTSDQMISSFLDRSLATSPLARLRKAKALYVPPGNDGQDRLLMELVDNDFPIKETCLFYRPTIQSFPQELLAKFTTGKNRRRRQEIAMQGYQSGRVNYTEVLPRKVLWDMIRRIPGKGFALYPPEATATDVISHLDHLQFLVRSVRSYELVLTDAFFPFYLNTFETTRNETIERFVLFFQYAEQENVRHVSTFALKDDAVYFSTQDRIIKWLLGHPTTIRNPEHILSEIQAVRTALLESVENPRMELPPAATLLQQKNNVNVEEHLAAAPEIRNVRKEEKAWPKKRANSGHGNRASRRES